MRNINGDAHAAIEAHKCMVAQQGPKCCSVCIIRGLDSRLSRSTEWFAVAAVHKGLETFKPFSRANKALEENVPSSKKDNIFYKIGHKITSVGKSLGYREKKTST